MGRHLYNNSPGDGFVLGGSTTTVTRNVDFIREARDREWSPLISSPSGCVTICWPDLALKTIFSQPMITTFLVECCIFVILKGIVSGLKISQSLPLFWHFYILKFYFMPKEKQYRQISNKSVNLVLQTKQLASRLFWWFGIDTQLLAIYLLQLSAQYRCFPWLCN